MTQIQGERTEGSFDGHIQLNGDAAPELEVIVALTDRHVILSHASGELGRWQKSAVRVVPVGRGWFSLDVEDENVAFRPRRPGVFAASTLDLAPVEETKKRRKQTPDKTKTAEAKKPKVSRKEKRRARRKKAASVSAPQDPPAGRRGGLTPLPPMPPADRLAAGPEPAPVEPPPSQETTPVDPPVVDDTPPLDLAEPARSATTWLDPSDESLPELFTRRSAPAEPEVPASPWDDVTLPEIPGRRGRKKKRRDETPSPDRTAKPTRRAGAQAPREKAAKPRREKAVKPSRAKEPKTRRERKAAAVAPIAAEPAGLPQKSASSRALTAFKYGAKGVMYRISDELRQSGIVPFDRLPAAPARIQPDEDHKHDFQEHRLPGGLTRNVCHGCGLVSIGESGGLDQ
jgi:hypothetical protein